MRALLVLFFITQAGCSAVAYRPDPVVGIAATTVEVVTKSPEEIQWAAPSAPGCEREARVWLWVTNLPAIREVYQADLWLAQKNPNSNEPKYIGKCVLNPFNPQNIAERGEK